MAILSTLASDIMNEPKLDGLLKDRFIRRTLMEVGDEIDEDMLQRMSSFSNETKSGRDFNTQSTTLQYSHQKRHRFIDMKTRNTKTGTIKKKSYSIHNRILYGHINDIITRIKFGFTDDVKKEMMKLDNSL